MAIWGVMDIRGGKSCVDSITRFKTENPVYTTKIFLTSAYLHFDLPKKNSHINIIHVANLISQSILKGCKVGEIYLVVCIALLFENNVQLTSWFWD